MYREIPEYSRFVATLRMQQYNCSKYHKSATHSHSTSLMEHALLSIGMI